MAAALRTRQSCHNHSTDPFGTADRIFADHSLQVDPTLSSAALARQAADRSMALQRLDPFGLTSGFAGIALGIGAIQSNIIDAAARELAAACVASIAGAL